MLRLVLIWIYQYIIVSENAKDKRAIYIRFQIFWTTLYHTCEIDMHILQTLNRVKQHIWAAFKMKSKCYLKCCVLHLLKALFHSAILYVVICK